jgi:ribosomal protein S18 acetylase RimI-like enzyme
MISFVLLRVLAQPHFDLSVLDEESGELASTVIVVDGSCSDPAGGGALRRARDAVLLFLRSSLLYYRMWRGGSLPEIVASSEWRADREDARRRLHTIRRFMAFARSTLMPPARRQRYWYVNLVATQPKFQRRGYGTRVIRAVCDLADEERVDLYLESAGDRNRRFYESAGFQVAASLRLDQIPPGEGGGAAGRSSQPAMEMYAMVRRHAKQD